MQRIYRALFALLLVSLSTPSFSASVLKHFALPGHGELLLLVPDNWEAAMKQPNGGLPPTIGLHDRSDHSFQVFMTPVWAIPPSIDAPDDSKIHSMVAAAAKSAEPHSVERPLSLHGLVGPNSRGYYFFATDQALAPGEWKYLTQGATRLGEISLTFTILTNDGQEADAKAALELVRLATQQ